MLFVTEIEMHKMIEIDNGPAVPTAESGRVYIEKLLTKYPSTTDNENLAILEFLGSASALADLQRDDCGETKGVQI